MNLEDFKYYTEIQNILGENVQMPPLFAINQKIAFRFVFSDKPEKNHIPVYKQKPRRIISDKDKNSLSTSGFALSCFEDENQAEKRYKQLKAHMKNISLTIGDALCAGYLSQSDGLITESNNETHYDLYEFKDCDLSQSLTIKKSLL